MKHFAPGSPHQVARGDALRAARAFGTETPAGGQVGEGQGKTETGRKAIEKESGGRRIGKRKSRKRERAKKRGRMPIKQARRQEKVRGTSEKSGRRYTWLE